MIDRDRPTYGWTSNRQQRRTSTVSSNAVAARTQHATYREFIDGAGVSLLLYFERLPECLLELPFVDPATIASFPHVLERGIRPPGDFDDFFDDRYEEFVWESNRDDFLVAGYERYNSGLAEGFNAAKWLRDDLVR